MWESVQSWLPNFEPPVLTFTWWDLPLFLLGCYIGIFAVLFVLPLIPGAIDALSNKPNRWRPPGTRERNYPVSRFGFFTKLRPGQVKIIERGERFITCIMRYAGRTFEGLLLGSTLFYNTREHWAVIETPEGQHDAHPIPFPRMVPPSAGFVRSVVLILAIPIRLTWWLWKRWVYELTGYVFSGIWPFQGVLTMPIERFEKVKHSDGSEEIIRIEDYTDHFRAADFQFPVLVPAADTQDKIPVKILVDEVLAVDNPYSAAYDTDNWSTRITAAISDGVAHFTRPRPIQKVLSASEENEIRDLAEAVHRIGDRSVAADTPNTSTQYGIVTRQTLIPDISPSRESDGIKLGALAFARVDADADAARGRGRAQNIRAQAAAVRDWGPYGAAVLEKERMVESAEKAGDRAIINFNQGGAPLDSVQVGQWEELKRLGRGRGSTEGSESE